MNIKNTSHKIISIITALLLLFSLSIPILSFAETSNISVYIDNKRVSFQANPYMENDRVMVPMRKIFEELGAAVTWDDDTQSVSAVKGQTTAILAIGLNIMYTVNRTLLTIHPISYMIQHSCRSGQFQKRWAVLWNGKTIKIE